jgi:FKBP-type peptidyl-prolyl cis-trans isomerase
MMRKIFIVLLISAGAVLYLSVTSCNPEKKFEREEEALISNYLQSNPTLAFQRKPSGLYYLDIEVGTGRLSVTSDTAFIKYTGKFLDGTVFDSNVERDDSLIFPVNKGFLIPGFDEGVTYMREGGKAMFLIPSNLAYGSSGYYMPAYTPVLFDVELVRIKPGPGK